MVANTEVLEQAGVAEIPTTLAEFRDALVAVRDNVPNSVPFTMATTNNGSILIDFMILNWVHGGAIIDADGNVVVDSEESRAALQFMVDLMEERLAAPEIDRPDSRRLFAQGASAFYFDAPQTRTFLRDFSGEGEAFDANILPIRTPVLNEGDPATSVQWGHLLIQFAPDGTPAAEDPADQFISYLTSDAVQTDFPLQMSALPVTNSAREAVADDAYLTAWADATGESRPNEVGIWANGADLTQIIGEEVQGALLGQQSVDDAISSMQQRLSDSMASQN
jgi:multiple sugar transport system substrate-binding protein